jgi:hypothetical protein
MGMACSMHGTDEKWIQILVGKCEGKRHLEYLGIDVRIILERILRNRVGSCGLDLSDSRQGPGVGSCEYSNELLGCIRGREFLNYLSDLASQGLCSMELLSKFS